MNDLVALFLAIIGLVAVGFVFYITRRGKIKDFHQDVMEDFKKDAEKKEEETHNSDNKTNKPRQ